MAGLNDALLATAAENKAITGEMATIATFAIADARHLPQRGGLQRELSSPSQGGDTGSESRWGWQKELFTRRADH